LGCAIANYVTILTLFDENMKSGNTDKHRGTILLKPEENEQIFQLIGNRCQVRAILHTIVNIAVTNIDFDPSDFNVSFRFPSSF